MITSDSKAPGTRKSPRPWATPSRLFSPSSYSARAFSKACCLSFFIGLRTERTLRLSRSDCPKRKTSVQEKSFPLGDQPTPSHSFTGHVFTAHVGIHVGGPKRRARVHTGDSVVAEKSSPSVSIRYSVACRNTSTLPRTTAGWPVFPIAFLPLWLYNEAVDSERMGSGRRRRTLDPRDLKQMRERKHGPSILVDE